MKTHYFLVLWVLRQGSGEEVNQDSSISYALDVSFPIQNAVSTNYPHLPHNLDPSLPIPGKYKDKPLQILGDRQSAYLQHLNGCRSLAGEYPTLCDQCEFDRLLMNNRQPQSMINMTEVGFKKVRAPRQLMELVAKFWLDNYQRPMSDEHIDENWGPGNSYFNVWDKPTKFISVDDRGLRGSGARLKRAVWASLSAVMEEWTQQELQPSSLYGIRVYQDGAVMLPQ
jgi:prolyl 4-hydroxylase